MKKTRQSLQPSESVIARMAAGIYAAHVSKGCVSESNAEEWMQRSVREATRIAEITEESLLSDEELH